MRHRAHRSLLHRLTVPGPARRGLLAAVALVVAATLTGVGVAVQDSAPRPSAAGGVLPTSGAPAPGTAPYSAATSRTPTGSVSRGESRDPVADGRTPTPETSREPGPTTAAPEPSLSASASAPGSTSAPAPGEIGGPTSSTTTQPSPRSGSGSASPADPSPSDDAPPETTASTRSADGDSWTVALGADEAASYQCSLDGSAYQPCGATVTYGDLDRGQHTFAARATDQAGNTDPTPAELSAKIVGRR